MQRTSRVTLWLVLATSACDRGARPEERSAPPPPPPTASAAGPGLCSGATRVADAEASGFFPEKLQGYCVDPNGEVRSYGEKAKFPLDLACTQLLDGECEVYKRYGLARIVTVRYLDGGGSGGEITVNLSRFAAPGGAYGFFTKRVLGDGDPLEASVTPIVAGGAAAAGSGIAYVWRGTFVAEISYANERESPDQLRASSKDLLPQLGKAMGDVLTGEASVPPSVGALPVEQRIALGVRYDADDVIEVKGAGPGAVGFYQDGERRWRVFAAVRPDEEGAKDVFATFKKLPGAREVKGQSFDLYTVARTQPDSPRVEWLVARKGNTVFGVGDEELVLTGDPPAEEAKKKKPTAEQRLEIVKRLAPPK